ncbi:MAG: hypothetical protein ACI9IV_000332 [Paracoccaceae bacterium]|jgi:uncharacterized protein YjiS (DUF1127 family)|tara:strand:+ start:175 stop:396 length:222 start_codon:yes stop_codon:yes gene_type:complete
MSFNTATAQSSRSNSLLGFTLLALPGIVMSLAAVARQRRALRDLSTAQLNDLGLTRAQAETEANRVFWDLRCN